MSADDEGMGRSSPSMALMRQATGGLTTPDGKGNLTEFDLVAYDKNDHTDQLSRNIMRRCFDAVDVEGKGFISKQRLQDLAKYLRLPEKFADTKQQGQDDRNLVAKFPEGASFDDFYSWWRNLDDWEGGEKFALVSAKFSEPFHVQQLFTKETGEKFSLSYRCNFYLQDTESGTTVQASPWHDIPLYVRSLVKTTSPADQFPLVNFVCEIPKWTRAKFEISRIEPFNPIKQDVKGGVPRFYRHGDMCFNYGAAPQSYEHAEIGFTMNDGTHYIGDNDPIDLIEIGCRQLPTGSVTAVKVLGILGMIDDGEMDWKVIVIDATDPLSRTMNDIEDVRKTMPGCLECLHEWLRTYKIVDGKPENQFVRFNPAEPGGEFYRDAKFAHEVIRESHRMWANLAQIHNKRNIK